MVDIKKKFHEWVSEYPQGKMIHKIRTTIDGNELRVEYLEWGGEWTTTFHLMNLVVHDLQTEVVELLGDAIADCNTEQGD